AKHMSKLATSLRLLISPLPRKPHGFKTKPSKTPPLVGAVGSACAAAWATPAAYYEVGLLSAAAAFLVTGVVVGGLLDARPAR
ncbi:hypothetical protein ABT203_33660, partial [Streptomyces sp900105245]